VNDRRLTAAVVGLLSATVAITVAVLFLLGGRLTAPGQARPGTIAP